MTYIEELYPIQPEIKKLYLFIGDWNRVNLMRTRLDQCKI